jgi:hypothetical protein
MAAVPSEQRAPATGPKLVVIEGEGAVNIMS